MILLNEHTIAIPGISVSAPRALTWVSPTIDEKVLSQITALGVYLENVYHNMRMEVNAELPMITYCPVWGIAIDGGYPLL